MNSKVRDILTELRRRFETLYDDRLVEMVLYGSQARGARASAKLCKPPERLLPAPLPREGL